MKRSEPPISDAESEINSGSTHHLAEASENLKGLQLCLKHKMCEVAVFSPEGHQWRINSFSEQALLKMTVGCFIEELVKVISTLHAISEYSKENIRLIIGDKPLDNSAPLSDYKVTSGTAMQMVRKVNGG